MPRLSHIPLVSEEKDVLRCIGRKYLKDANNMDISTTEEDRDVLVDSIRNVTFKPAFVRKLISDSIIYRRHPSKDTCPNIFSIYVSAFTTKIGNKGQPIANNRL